MQCVNQALKVFPNIDDVFLAMREEVSVSMPGNTTIC